MCEEIVQKHKTAKSPSHAPEKKQHLEALSVCIICGIEYPNDKGCISLSKDTPLNSSYTVNTTESPLSDLAISFGSDFGSDED